MKSILFSIILFSIISCSLPETEKQLTEDCNCGIVMEISQESIPDSRSSKIFVKNKCKEKTITKFTEKNVTNGDKFCD